MIAAAKHHQQQSQSKASKNPTAINPATPQSNHHENHTSAAPPFTDEALSRATHITRKELLRRRSHKLKKLSKCYRDHYWALMEELKLQYREYDWRYGLSPFKEDRPQSHKQDRDRDFDIEVIGQDKNGNGSNLNRNLELKNNLRCLFVPCKLKAIALTSFCHLHILSDAKQKLYKPCGFVIKRLRHAHNFREVQQCTLLSIKTGGCGEDCTYCPQSSRYNTGLKSQRPMTKEAVTQAARKAKEAGSTRFCMGAAWRDTIGRKTDFNQILDYVEEIRDMGMEVCCTLCMLEKQQALELKKAGLTAYNHNLDTSRILP